MAPRIPALAKSSARELAARLVAETSGSTRVWILTLAMGTLALALGLFVMPRSAPVQAPITIPVWALAIAFFVVEARVIHLHIGRSAHSFSMSELPLVAGLFLVSPIEFALARVIGSGLALIVSRGQRSVKLAFNLAQFALGSVVTVILVGIAAAVDPFFGPLLWLGVLGAILVENVIGIFAIATAISLAEATPHYRRIPEMIRIGAIVSMTNGSLALMGLTVVWANTSAAWLFIVPIATAAMAYRAYVSQRQQHESIQLLYESTRILQRSPQLDTALISLLEHARKMFRADVAEVLLLPSREGDDVLRSSVGPGDAQEVMVPAGPTLDDPMLIQAITERRSLRHVAAPDRRARDAPPGGRSALVAPLVGESSVVGTFRLMDRLSDISAFDEGDLKLFETLANHTAVALENGQLEQSLERLSVLKEELDHQASHDALTGLANRSLFVGSVARRLEEAQGDAPAPVVLFIDLDDFKLVNDSLGHAAGDALLIAVADRIRSVVRDHDVASRIGGDEFAILLGHEPDLEAALAVAHRLSEAMAPLFAIDGREITVRASIGVATGRPGVDTAGDLVRNADVAMYSAKARGKGRVVVFEPSMHDAVMIRAQLSSDLERAISAGQFTLQYQPIVAVATGRTVSVEALVRWDHPERGRIGPDDFIRVAGESEAILGIGRWVLGEACAQASTWRHLPGAAEVTVAVNISARQLAQPTFVPDVLATIAAARIEPATLVLEMTETAMLQDSSATRRKLEELRAAGVGISVDDFGTGYSSLSYLQRFPVTTLKIARDFVDVAGTDPEAWELANAIIALGRALRLSVIAEGVERQSQLENLRSLGCEYAQGFYFARPLDPAAIPPFLARDVGRPAAASSLRRGGRRRVARGTTDRTAGPVIAERSAGRTSA